MATRQAIGVAMGRFSVVYRQPLSEKEIDMLTTTWLAVLEDMPDEDFFMACKAHLGNSRYFPVPADIVREHNALPKKRKTRPALPEAEGNRARRKIFAAMCLRAARGDTRAKAFFAPDRTEGERAALVREVLGDRLTAAGCAGAA